MRGADVDDHAHVRLGDRRQLGDLPGPRIAISSTSTSCRSRRRQQRQRQPDLGVEVRRARRHAHPITPLALTGARGRARPSSAARMSFVEVLPVEPVIATTFAPRSRSSTRHARASACSAASGSACASTTPARSRVPASAIAPARAATAACSGATSTPHAPAAQRLRRKRPAVRALSGQAHEQLARGERARVDARTGRAHRAATGTRPTAPRPPRVRRAARPSLSSCACHLPACSS